MLQWIGFNLETLMKVVLQVLDELILTNPVFTNLLEEVLSMTEELEINDSSSAYT